MWFEALGAEAGARPSAWFQSLIVALLQGRQDVLDLLEPGPWTEDPPRFVRARLYQYHFRRPPPGNWWERTFVRDYVPPVYSR
jgi:hypothetical protein